MPAAVADTSAVHARFMRLVDVERDFRTMKTALLELRPIFLRKAERTEGHALVTILALKLVRELDRRVALLGLTVEDAVARTAPRPCFSSEMTAAASRQIRLGLERKIGLTEIRSYSSL